VFPAEKLFFKKASVAYTEAFLTGQPGCTENRSAMNVSCFRPAGQLQHGFIFSCIAGISVII
jgi:hypothetical protein